ALWRHISTLEGLDIIGFYDGQVDKGLCPVRLLQQQGDDLGERLVNGFERLFNEGFKRVCIIGSDSPTLPTKYIYNAFKMLDMVDLVIGPTIDGGYYLIGLNNPIPQLFKDISWGSDKVFHQTMQIAHALRLTYHILPKWYDIDDVFGLEKMVKGRLFE
ncbi:MAG: TIGR04282 family arsenosugar biosynthesis glycosyltransferase, partial [Thermodesulfovibrionales bacterium]